MHPWKSQQHVQCEEKRKLAEFEQKLFEEAIRKLYQDLKDASPDIESCEKILIRSEIYDQLSERKAAHVRDFMHRLCAPAPEEENPSLGKQLISLWDWLVAMATSIGAFIGCMSYITGKETLADLFPTLVPLLDWAGQIPTLLLFAGFLLLLMVWILARWFFRR